MFLRGKGFKIKVNFMILVIITVIIGCIVVEREYEYRDIETEWRGYGV